MNEMLMLADGIAELAHLGQTDKLGRPYIEHPRWVRKQVRLEYTVDSNRNVQSTTDRTLMEAIALLHDVLEDSPLTGEDLRGFKFPDVVVDCVVAITRKPGQSLEDYCEQIMLAHWYTRHVKLLDVRHNTDPRRLIYLDEPTQLRLIKKYSKTLDLLNA